MLKICASLTVAAGLVGAAYSQVLYDNFDSSGGYATSSYTLAPIQSVADEFTVTSTTNLGLIQIAATGTGNFDLQLDSDAAGVPGPVLKDWAFTITGPEYFAFADPSVTLGPGNYFVSVVTTDPNAMASWYQNDIGDNTTWFYTDSGGQWNPFSFNTPVMEVTAAAGSVPGPVALLPFAVGLVAVSRRRLRR